MTRSGTDILEQTNNQVVKILRSIKGDYSKTQTANGLTYVIEVGNVQLAIELSVSWIGYKLRVDTSYNKILHTSLDTDNYALDFNLEVTQEIAQELLLCLESVIDKKILVGKKGRKYILAIPITGESYRVEEQGFTTKVYELDRNQIANLALTAA